MEIFIEITLILLVATLVSILMKMLRQPLVIGYILTGILLGPFVFNIIHSQETIELFSKLGITILLFIVGLHLSPRVIKEVGSISILTGVAQVLITSTVGFLIALFLGIERVPALYVAIGLTFSSTIIILKLLSDKGDLNKLYGKIAIGFLIVQDVIATIILLVTSSIAGAEGTNLVLFVVLTLLKGGALIALFISLSNIVLPRLMKFLAASQELLFIFSITWGLGFAALFHVVGFSVEIGALVAGVAMSMTPYAFEISSRLRPLRDFFILLFFILLGSQMVLDDFGSILLPAVILSLFVLIGNPIIMVVIMSLMRYGKRTSFLAGLTVAQISEFSLILAALGFQIGHIDRQTLSLLTLVGLITIGGSTYLILYSDKIYPAVEGILAKLQLKRPKSEVKKNEYDAILFGYQRVGKDFVRAMQNLDLKPVIVDYNPGAIELVKADEQSYIYGDAGDPEFLDELELAGVKFIVSTIPDFETNAMLVRRIRATNTKATILVLSDNVEQAETLYTAGATYVIMPHYVGARHARRIIAKYGIKRKEYKELRERHQVYLEKREI